MTVPYELLSSFLGDVYFATLHAMVCGVEFVGES